MDYEYSINMKSGVTENNKHYFCIRFDENPLLNKRVVNVKLLLSMSPGSHKLLKNPPPFVGNLILVGARKPLFTGSAIADPSGKSKVGYVSDISRNEKIRIKFDHITPMNISRKDDAQWEPIGSTYSHLDTVSLRPISDNIIANTLKLPERLAFRI